MSLTPGPYFFSRGRKLADCSKRIAAVAAANPNLRHHVSLPRFVHFQRIFMSYTSILFVRLQFYLPVSFCHIPRSALYGPLGSDRTIRSARLVARAGVAAAIASPTIAPPHPPPTMTILFRKDLEVFERDHFAHADPLLAVELRELHVVKRVVIVRRVVDFHAIENERRRVTPEVGRLLRAGSRGSNYRRRVLTRARWPRRCCNRELRSHRPN